MAPQIQGLFPKRMPELVQPKSLAPWDIAAAQAAAEHDAYQTLIKEPAEAAGITPLPELPGPGTLISMLVTPLQNFFGGLTKAGQGGGQGDGYRGEEKKEEKPTPPARARMRGEV